jgi:predicted Zn-dependent protease
MRRLVALVLAVALQAPAAAADPDPATLLRGSEIAYRRALAADAEKKALNADAAATQQLRRIANRLIGAAPAIEPASRNYRWEVNVRAGPAADVRAYPGGHLLVNDGLVTRTGMKDDEVAAVVAFAIARLLLGQDVAHLAAGADAATRSPDPNRQVLAWPTRWRKRCARRVTVPRRSRPRTG